MDLIFLIFLSVKLGFYLLLTFTTWTLGLSINKIANRWMTVFIFSLSIIFLKDLLIEANSNVWQLILAFDFFYFLIPVSFYLSISSFTRVLKSPLKHEYMLFIPIGIDIFIKGYFFISYQNLEFRYLEEEVFFFETWYKGLFIVFSLSLLFLMLRRLFEHRKGIAMFNADIRGVDLKWVSHLLMIAFSLIITSLLFNFSNLSIFIHIADIIQFIVPFYMGFHLLKQQEVFAFSDYQLKDVSKVIDSSTPSNKMDMEEINLFRKKLLQVMSQEKPFLNSTITLLQLSEMLELKPYKLSYLLNKEFEKNFYTFINEYRIEESKKILMNPKKQYLSIIGVAFESGFNSKTTFNTTFKKFLGKSPSEFKKERSI